MPIDEPSYRYTDRAFTLVNEAKALARRFKNDKIYPIHFAFVTFEPDGSSDSDYSKTPPKTREVPFWTASLGATIDGAGGDAGVVMNTMKELVTSCLPTTEKCTTYPSYSEHVNEILSRADSIRESRRDAYVAPHHLLLALIHAPDIECILRGANLSHASLEKAVMDLRGKIRVYKRKEGRKVYNSYDYLDKYFIDLTALAEKDQVHEAIGREEETGRLMRILSRKTKNSPCLIGNRGVGKTTIARDLARRIVFGETPRSFCSIVLELSIVQLRGTGEYDNYVKKMIGELRRLAKSDTLILFFDDLELAARDDGMNLWADLIGEGVVRCFGTASRTGYNKYVAGNILLERHLAPVVIEEPTLNATIAILRGVRERYEKHHGVLISDAALQMSAMLSNQYIRDRLLPDKAIDLIDEACAHVNILRGTSRKIVEGDASAALPPENNTVESPTLEPDVVTEIVAKWTRIPISRLVSTEKQSLLRLESGLMASVVGQPEAVKAVASAIRLSRSGLGNKQRPIASFLFAGTTGTGKTLLTKTLAKLMFHSSEAMIRIDCSEYIESHSVSKLIGSPPGYVGYHEGGQLTEYIRQKPYSIVLLDELEKAHKKFLTIFLQVLDDGRLTDGKGNVVDFRNTVIIMTSNIGASHLDDVVGRAIPPAARKLMMGAIEAELPPEFINRLDDVIIFRKLCRENIKGIIDIRLKEVQERIDESKLTLDISSRAKDYLIDAGYSPRYGARPLNRIIQREVLHPLSVMRLADQILDGETIKIEFDEKKQRLAIQPNHPSPNPDFDHTSYTDDEDVVMDDREPNID